MSSIGPLTVSRPCWGEEAGVYSLIVGNLYNAVEDAICVFLYKVKVCAVCDTNMVHICYLISFIILVLKLFTFFIPMITYSFKIVSLHDGLALLHALIVA